MSRNLLKITEVKACTFIVLSALACFLLMGASGENKPTYGGDKWEYCRAFRLNTGPGLDPRKTFIEHRPSP